MRALFVPAAGAPAEVGDLPTPTVTDGSVLIRVKAASLNPIDNAVPAGTMAETFPQAYPLTLGRDAAGVVESVGAGVEHLRAGDAVLGFLPPAPPIQAGTLAEFAVLPASAAAVKPAGLDFVTAAAIPLAGAAAAGNVDALDLRPGQTVLVNGASGGVGSIAVQLLVARGVTVVAVNSAATADRARGLGAAAVLDYAAGPVADQARARYPECVDALMNLAGFDPSAIPVSAVKRGGKVASLTIPPDPGAIAAAVVTAVVAGLPERLSEVFAWLAAQAAAGVLTVPVTAVLPLDRAAEGLAALAANRAHGKIVVALD